MAIKFGEYMPDQPDFEHVGGLTEAKNIVSDGGTYSSIPGATVYSTAMNSRPLGAWAGLDAGGTIRIYAATKTKLYDLTTSTPFDLSNGVTFDCPDDGWTEFVKWGDTILATNGNDNIQAMTLGGTAMADLAAAAPKARHICTAKNFVIVANTYDTSDGQQEQRVWWSADGDSTNWPTPGTSDAAAVLSGKKDLQDASGGWINRIFGGEFVTIFLQKAIYTMRFVGGAGIWQFDKVEENKGLVTDQAAAKFGAIVYYLDKDGFYAFDGIRSTPIGDGKVDQFFWDNVNTTYIHKCYAAVWPEKKAIIWGYVDSTAGGTDVDRQLIYDTITGRWTRAEITDQYLFSSLSRGYTLDGLDAISTDIDSFTESLDSRQWNANNSLLSGFDTSQRMVDYTGTAMAASVITGEIEPEAGFRSMVRGIRPIVNGGPTVTTYVGTRDLQSGTVAYDAGSTVNSRTGVHYHRVEGRFHRARIDTSGAFTNLVGFDFDHSVEGQA